MKLNVQWVKWKGDINFGITHISICKLWQQTHARHRYLVHACGILNLLFFKKDNYSWHTNSSLLLFSSNEMILCIRGASPILLLVIQIVGYNLMPSEYITLYSRKTSRFFSDQDKWKKLKLFIPFQKRPS